MQELLSVSYWHWFALAFILLALEITAPVTFFLWLCFAALASAIVSLMFPELGLATQLFLFSLFCVLSIGLWWRFGFTGREKQTDNPTLNRRNERYLGRVVKLSQAIEGGTGKVTVEDSQWKVTGPDLDAGTMVRVTKVDGSLFHVEPVS